MGSTVEDLQQRMSSWEFAHWLAYFHEEPFGWPAEAWRMGVVAATVANSVPRKRGSRALKPSDFFNQRQTPSAPLTDRQRASLVKRRAARKAKTKAKEGIHG